MPRLLELFSGTKSVSKVAKALGWETISLDIDPKFDPDLCMDILDFNYTCLLYTSPSPRDQRGSRMPSSA